MKLILIFALVVLVLVFVLQNAGTMEVKFLLWKVTVSKALVVFISLAIGFLAGIGPRWRKIS